MTMRFEVILLSQSMTPDKITKIDPSNCTHVVVYFPDSQRGFDFWHVFAAVDLTMEIVGQCGTGRHCSALAMTGVVWKTGTYRGILDDLENYMAASMSLIRYDGRPGSNCTTILDMLHKTGMHQIVFTVI